MAHLDRKLNVNQVCWRMESSKTCRAGGRQCFVWLQDVHAALPKDRKVYLQRDKSVGFTLRHRWLAVLHKKVDNCQNPPSQKNHALPRQNGTQFLKQTFKISWNNRLHVNVCLLCNKIWLDPSETGIISIGSPLCKRVINLKSMF